MTAYENNATGTVPGLDAGADLTAKQFTCAAIANDGQVISPASSGDAVVGVLQNNPDEGEAAAVWGPGSTSKVVLGATLAPGAVVMAEGTSGKVIAATAAGYALGVLLTGGDEDELGTVYITLGGAVPA